MDKHFFRAYRDPLTVVIILIILAGAFSYSRMQTSLFPEITFPKIKVIVDAGQLPVDKMMFTVTRPIEKAMKQVPDLKLLRSTTSRGSSELSAFMDWKTNIDISQQRIESKINEIRNELPADVQITVERMNPSILPVSGYTLESKKRSPIDLRMLAMYTIKPFLSQVDGVSEVRIIGGKTKEFWLSLNVQMMASLGITPDAVNTALSLTNFIKSNGYLNDHHMMYLTVTDAHVVTKNDLENLVISNDGKRIVLLKNIAEVNIQEQKEYIKINANGKDGILVAVIKQPNSNLVEISSAMEKKIAELRKVLPKDVTIRPYYLQADFVNDSVKSVTDSLWIGLALAIFVAIIFLRSLKASATILITIPVILCVTLIVLFATGQTFNIMTLGAIAASIGLIIDDAIVVVEQIHRTHEEHPDEATNTLITRSIRYLLPAMVGSSLSTIVIFLPFILMSGVAGAYFKVMTNTMIITLTCSFFVTWLLLPVIYILLSKKERKVHEIKLQHKKVANHGRWIKFFITKPWLSFIFILMLGGLMWWIIPQLETGFLPDMDEGSIVLDYNSPPGTSLEETDRILREAEKLIVQVPEVETYSRRTGTQMGFFITEPNRGDYLIQLKKDRKRTTDEVIDDIRQRIESTQPSLRIDFGQVIGDMLGDMMSSVQPIEVKVYGTDRKKLQELSIKISDVVDSVEGTADVFNGIVIAGPSISVIPRSQMLAQFGITPADFQFQLQTALEGNIAGGVLEKEQLTNIRLVYPGNTKLTLEDIEKLLIFLPDGRLKPITDLADIKLDKGDAEVERENLQSMGVVTGRLDSRDLGSVMSEIQEKVEAKVDMPQGYHVSYGGAYAEQQQSFKELMMILISSCLLVFGVILFLFRDVRASFMILFIAVLGISGSVFALFISDTPLNVGSYTGLIMIVGIIGENAIFTFLQFRESVTSGKSVDEAITFSISTRLRPKLMTAFGAIIALSPIAFGIGTGAQLHQPLAIAVIGGFIAALPLLLIVLPSMLRVFYKKRVI